MVYAINILDYTLNRNGSMEIKVWLTNTWEYATLQVFNKFMKYEK
jgi:hypothetical protein